VILIGRLTRDPEIRVFTNGGKVAKIGFAVTNRKKNSQTGQWEDEPMFIDCDVFNRGENGTLANLVEERCRKGTQLCIEGKLHLESWDDKTSGQKRTKHKIVVESFQFLDPRPEGFGGESTGSTSKPLRSAPATQTSGSPNRSGFSNTHDSMDEPPSQTAEDDIPF
jgi:single-strand DNA-binding protein